MMLNYYSLFYGILSLIPVVFYFGFLVFVFTRFSRYPKPSGPAMLAIGSMLLLGIVQPILSMTLPRIFQTEQFLAINLVINFLTTIGHLAAVGLLLWAVYTDRRNGTQDANEPMVRSTLTSDNPYGPPSNE